MPSKVHVMSNIHIIADELPTCLTKPVPIPNRSVLMPVATAIANTDRKSLRSKTGSRGSRLKYGVNILMATTVVNPRNM